MWFRRLDIHDVRNLAAVRLELIPGLNYFHGGNGAGKTAILEAVHLLARGRSFRSAQTADVIRRGQNAMQIHAVVEDEHRGTQTLGLSRGRGGEVALKINGEPARRVSDAAGLLPLQVLVPSLSDLVFGGPGERRQWLDWGTFHVEPGFLSVLRRYLHALRQRNAALKTVATGRLGEEGLAVWTDSVVVLAEEVTVARRRYLENLVPELTAVLAELAPGLELEVRYRQGWSADDGLRKVLGDSLPREVKFGSTQSGPHRADVELRVAGLPAGTTLSRGQGKALASAMMLSQARLLLRTARRSSVFLIDDIGAELDLPHSERFFRLLMETGAQVLATSNVGPRGLAGLAEQNIAMFHVEHGSVQRQTSDP